MTTVEIRRNADRQPYLVVKARNGEVLLTSESYASDWHAERAAVKLRRRFVLARVADKRP